MQNKLKLIFGLSLLLVLTGCKQDNPPTPPAPTETTAPTSSEAQTEESTSETEISSSETEMTIEDTSPTISETETTQSNPIDNKYKDNEAYQNIRKFIEYMQDKNFKAMSEVLNLYNNSVITPDELEIALRESKWKELLGTRGEFNLISFDQRKENEKTLTFKINSKQYDITAVMSNDGHWKVSIADLIVENYQFLVPGDVTVAWGEQELDRAKFAKRYSQNNLLDLYTVTCVPQEITISYTSSAFGDYSETLTPSKQEKAHEMNRDLSEDREQEVLNTIKDLWNNMVHDCMDGISLEGFSTKYFDTNVAKETVKQVYDEIIEYIGEDKYITIDMIEIEKWEGEFFAVSMDRVVTANFTYQTKMRIYLPPKYEKRWNKNGTYYYVEIEQEPQYKVSDKINSHIRIKQIDDGSFIIYEMTDINLFVDQ